MGDTLGDRWIDVSAMYISPSLFAHFLANISLMYWLLPSPRAARSHPVGYGIN